MAGLSGDPEKRERQLGALRRHAFKPGKSGNPEGRPPDVFIRTVLARLSDKDLEAAADAFIANLRGGDLAHLREFMDRTAGKAVQQTTSDVNLRGGVVIELPGRDIEP